MPRLPPLHATLIDIQASLLFRPCSCVVYGHILKNSSLFCFFAAGKQGGPGATQADGGL